MDWLNSARKQGRDSRLELTETDIDAALEAAFKQLRFTIRDLVPDDPLLEGAMAVLDRESFSVWINSSLRPPTRRFTLAHELGHAMLDSVRLVCGESELAIESSRASRIGYSPRDRSELRANAFAAEFLITGIREDWSQVDVIGPLRFADQMGLPRETILRRLLGEDDTASDSPSELESEPVVLDPSQTEAAVADGPALIEAGPGTGKTRTLVGRVHRLLDMGHPPDSILALTFSVRAADEMRDRLRQTTRLADSIWIGTFHSFALDVLRRCGEIVGFAADSRLMDQAEACENLADLMSNMELTALENARDPLRPAPHVLGAISRLQDELITSGDLEDWTIGNPEATSDSLSEVALIYSVWQSWKRENSVFEFGDLIPLAILALKRQPEILATLRSTYQNILVDEYQDVNRGGASLVKLLAQDGHGLWVVGDTRQAIYRFRGASPANVTQFLMDYPTGRKLALQRTFRSEPALVALFDAAAGRMDRPSGGWQPVRQQTSGTITNILAPDTASVLAGVVDDLQQALKSGVNLRETSILCRTRAQVAAITEALREASVPVSQPMRYWENPAVRSLVSWLSAAIAEDVVARKRLELTLADTDIEAKLTIIRSYAAIASTLWEWAASTLITLRAAKMDGTLEDTMAITQMMGLIRRYSDRKPGPPHATFEQFMDYFRNAIRFGDDGGRISESTVDQVQVMTIHGAKGLEFRNVVLPFLSKGEFPPRKPPTIIKLPDQLIPSDDVDGREEERLLFVALSRARDTLTLVSAGTKEDRCAAFHLIPDDVITHRRSYPLAELPIQAIESRRKTSVRLSELMTYEYCPRRYYYGHIIGLTPTKQSKQYQSYIEVASEVMHLVADQASTGNMLSQNEILLLLMDRLEAKWGKPASRSIASRLSKLASQWSVSPPSAAQRKDLSVHLPDGGDVTFSSPSIRKHDEQVTAELDQFDRPSESHKVDSRWALTRLAEIQAGESSAQLQVRYHLTGEAIPITRRPKTMERDLLKLSQLIERIECGDFTPNPSAESCARCQFLLLCPN